MMETPTQNPSNGGVGMMNMDQAANILNWNPSNLDIKSKSVEKTLEPLVLQVTTLVSSKSPAEKKGKSKRAQVLVAAVERATANFVERGQQIALENPEIEAEMIQAVQEVQETGEAMGNSAREFATDPCSSSKRGNMVMIYIAVFMLRFGVESYKLIYHAFNFFIIM
jgi:catenin alpha